jgi:hypothetical protein
MAGESFSKHNQLHQANLSKAKVVTMADKWEIVNHIT